MFDVIYQFLISLVAKILSWFGVSLGQTSEKASEESASASASTPSSDVPPLLLPLPLHPTLPRMSRPLFFPRALSHRICLIPFPLKPPSLPK
jgi:hypothetical protein